MSTHFESAGHQLLSAWQKLHNKPLGKWLFKRIIARNVPYTGSIKADVQQLRPGHCEVLLKHRHSNTNHLNCIHALALANLGELAGGLAMMTGLPPSVRGIVTRINTEYLKKARGDLHAVAEVTVPEVTAAKTVHHVHARIHNQHHELVTRVEVEWLLSPKT